VIDIQKIRIVSSGAMNPAVNISRYMNHVYIKVYFQFSTYLPITLYLITIIISSLASLNFNEKALSTSFFYSYIFIILIFQLSA